MSEFINNHSLRKEKLKEALRQIHEGKPYQEVKEFSRKSSAARPPVKLPRLNRR